MNDIQIYYKIPVYYKNLMYIKTGKQTRYIMLNAFSYSLSVHFMKTLLTSGTLRATCIQGTDTCTVEYRNLQVRPTNIN